jgi:bacillithiol biosynthesis cysteine-adding enzyme BshC
MKVQYIEYHETDCFSPTVIRYLNRDEKIKPFINQFPDLESFKKIISERKFNGDRNNLVAVLKAQYQNITPQSEFLISNISALQSDQTFTITTGHQLNIFTGPLYFIFKIVTAINLAKSLKKDFPNQNFVPVYWMATEDHDFEEINHTYIGGKKISWKLNAAGATGRLNTKTILQALNEYKGVLGLSPNAEKLASLVSKAYTDFTSLADATRYLVNELFGDYGLVILDADDSSLKRQFAATIEKDMIGQHSFRTITDKSKKLEELSIHAQVNPREINFFYLTDDLRERIVFENGKYQVLNAEISFSEQELKEEIKAYPERFSPNVVMRPLYQEVVLPNLAYVGGGGELAYWLQLKANFDFYKVDFPLLILRNSAMLADEKVEHKLERLNLSFTEIFKESESLKKTYVKKYSPHDLSLQDEWKQLSTIFNQLKEKASKIDPTLKPSTEAVEARLKKAMTSLEQKLIRAEKRNFSEAIHDIENIKNQLFPGGGLQERKENFGLFYVKYGDDFIAQLIKNFNPLAFQFTILYS